VLSLVVLISGTGSNLRALLDASEDAEFPARVVAIGADRDADGFAHAEEYGIPTFSVALSNFPDRDAWGDALLEQIEVWNPDLVVLSGFMKLLPPRVVAALSPRLINTHPAYLPEFPGAHGVRDALSAGVTQTGASVIVVDNGVDSGPIVAQRRVPVLPGDTESRLHERIKLIERELLTQAVLDIANGVIDLARPEARPGASVER
jgi:phosphoribosylglycinamide formyltransferase 1